MIMSVDLTIGSWSFYYAVCSDFVCLKSNIFHCENQHPLQTDGISFPLGHGGNPALSTECIFNSFTAHFQCMHNLSNFWNKDNSLLQNPCQGSMTTHSSLYWTATLFNYELMPAGLGGGVVFHSCHFFHQQVNGRNYSHNVTQQTETGNGNTSSTIPI